MRDKADIIRELQQRAKFHYAEGEKCEQAATILSQGTDALLITGVPNTKHPEYQHTWDILEKIKFIEAINHRFWPLSLMEELLIDLEGNEKAALLFPMLRAFVYRAVGNKSMIKMKYEGTRSCFYSTHQEWVERNPEDAVPFRVIEHYAPDPIYLKRLTVDQLSPEKITWEGIA